MGRRGRKSGEERGRERERRGEGEARRTSDDIIVISEAGSID